MSRFFFILLLTAMTVMPVMAATLDGPAEKPVVEESPDAPPEASREFPSQILGPEWFRENCGALPPSWRIRYTVRRKPALSERQPWTGQGRVGLQSWKPELGPPPLSHRDLGPVPIVVDGFLWPTHEPTRLRQGPAAATRRPNHRS